MVPENQSINLLSITRARAKMYEYGVPEQYFNSITQHPDKLLVLTIGILGDFHNRNRQSSNLTADEKSSMLFSAQFFDAFLNSRLNHSIGNYLLLLGSSAYYLCELPGSSRVLIDQLDPLFPELDGDCLEFLLTGLLRNSFAYMPALSGKFADDITAIVKAFLLFFESGSGDEDCLNIAGKLRKQLYRSGTDRQLLLIDTALSVMAKRFNHSSWKLLPQYTGSTLAYWQNVITKPGFIKEFWPAQILLGQQGIYRGRSAVVQMPTSAGKTRSIELIIRSSFTAQNNNLAVIVAPFKALCNEIKQTLQSAFLNESVRVDAPSDAFQVDFVWVDDDISDPEKLILILTPEKFLYMLRQSPNIATELGLLVYDEGHQFDNGIRGVTYELLLSSLRLAVSSTTQIVLISAVIYNAAVIGQWLIGPECEIVNGLNLLPTYRTVGFASWHTALGRIEYVRPEDPDIDDFYVPRVLQTVTLNKKGLERKNRNFPERDDGQSIAIYLGLKLVSNGALAIFCGSKPTVNTISEKVQDLVERTYTTNWPSAFSDSTELAKLKFLHQAHFGASHALTKNCDVGVFSHSGNTPQGLRLCIEYAMQHGHIRFLICTSTLAQGVNLPIRYLLVTSFYQAQEKIKTRDFHNLIGRAGRSGIHTEGSVLFSDPEIYDEKSYRNNPYTWGLAKGLLDASLSEPCSSTILQLFDPVRSTDGKLERPVDVAGLANAYIAGDSAIDAFITEIHDRRVNLVFTMDHIRAQIRYKFEILAAVESYLMAHWESRAIDQDDSGITTLVAATLAYALADEHRREELISLFQKLAERVSTAIPSATKKAGFGKTLLGVNTLLKIEAWVNRQEQLLIAATDEEALLHLLWPLLTEYLVHKNFNKLFPETGRNRLAIEWIKGESYEAILNSLAVQNAFLRAGSQQRNVKQETVIDIADGALGYDSTLIVAAIAEILRFMNHEKYQELIDMLELLQKRLKYGLPSALAIAFYEHGFADRILAQELAESFSTFPTLRFRLTAEIKANADAIRIVLNKYPAYFNYVLRTL
jgi:POLQ-like helicase